MKKILDNPAYSEWSSIIENNKRLSAAVQKKIGENLIASARQALIEETQIFEDELSESSKFKNNGPELVVLSGHQPVIYHPGLLHKAQALSKISSEKKATGVHIVLDTDEGEAVEAIFPEQTKKGPILNSVNITDKPGLYANQRVIDIPGPENIKNIISHLITQSIISAHVKIREKYEDRNYGVVPLSKILKRSEFWPTLTMPLSDPSKFFEIYNNSLDQFRLDHKIDNKANPFPNLVKENGKIECPYWIVDIESNKREKLFVILDEKVGRFVTENKDLVSLPIDELQSLPSKIPNNLLLSPRGGWVSAFFRIGISDLFIHGLGGAKYDVFVDQFVSNWLGIELPKFVSSSATQYLFSLEQEKFEKANKVKTEYKDIIARTESYLGTGLFDKELETKLESLIKKRASLIAELKTAAADRLQVAKKELNDLKLEIRSLIEGSSLSEMLKLADTDEQVVKAWCSREYPVFLF